jgi:HAD superfamily hydrolase (TIGR01450 family)
MFWVFDLDGVVWLAGHAIDGSAAAIAALRARGDQVAFVTNNSTPTVAEYVERLSRAGVEVGSHELVTSAQAAASIVQPGTKAAYLGGPGVKEALEARSVEIVPASSKPETVVVGRALELDFAELAHAASAIRGGARFVATNDDATFPTPHGLEPGAGALIAYLQVGSGTQAEVAGKPNAAMATLLEEKLGHPDYVVGDRPDTDGLFAARISSPFVLVLSGVTSRSDLPVEPHPSVVADDLRAAVHAIAGV